MGVLQKCAVDDDIPPVKKGSRDQEVKAGSSGHDDDSVNVIGNNVEAKEFQFAKHFSRKWSSGAGARIVCVRDYPAKLQFQALEHVNLSPRTKPGHFQGINAPIPSPRPSPQIHLSPRLACMGLPSPRLHVSTAN
jgi:hypothetical protein